MMLRIGRVRRSGMCFWRWWVVGQFDRVAGKRANVAKGSWF